MPDYLCALTVMGMILLTNVSVRGLKIGLFFLLQHTSCPQALKLSALTSPGILLPVFGLYLSYGETTK